MVEPDTYLITEVEEFTRGEVVLEPDSIVTAKRIYGHIEQLVGNDEITIEQGEKLRLAVTISSRIHDSHLRRDGFRTYSTGHIYPTTELIVKNKHWIGPLVKDEVGGQVTITEESQASSGTREQNALYKSVLVMLAHDWYEENNTNEEELEKFRKHVKQQFGEDIDYYVGVLTKEKKPPNEGPNERAERNRRYFENLRNTGMKFFAVIKMMDRADSHDDDFGVVNIEKVAQYMKQSEEDKEDNIIHNGMAAGILEMEDLTDTQKAGLLDTIRIEQSSANSPKKVSLQDAVKKTHDYITETKEYILPWIKEMLPENVAKEFELKVDDLETDSLENIDFLTILDDLSKNFLTRVRSDGTTWYDHTRRMIELIKKHGLRPTAGFVGALLLHDLAAPVEGDGTSGYSFPPEVRRILGDLIKIVPRKGLYSIGLALGTQEVERMMTHTLRNPGLEMYQHVEDEKQLQAIKDVYEGSIFLTFEELKESGNMEIEPMVPPVITMIQFMNLDIEAMLIVALERLDNLRHPPRDENGNQNAAYQWKAAQELLSLQSILELGGFSSLANEMRGEALGFLYSTSEEYELIANQYSAYVSFIKNYGKRIEEIVRGIGQSKDGPQPVIRVGQKKLGSAVKKAIDSKRKRESDHNKIGDLFRLMLVYPDVKSLDADSVLKFIENVSEELRLALGGNLEISIEHPRSGDRTESLHIRTSNKKDIEEWPIKIPEHLVGKVKAEEVPEGVYQSTKMYLKIIGLQDFPDGAYFEIQLTTETNYIESLIGRASHVIYKLEEGGIKPELLEDIIREIEKIYYRMALYRAAPHGSPYLTDWAKDLLKKAGFDIELPTGENGSMSTVDQIPPTPELDKERLRNLIPVIT